VWAPMPGRTSEPEHDASSNLRAGTQSDNRSRIITRAMRWSRGPRAGHARKDCVELHLQPVVKALSLEALERLSTRSACKALDLVARRRHSHTLVFLGLSRCFKGWALAHVSLAETERPAPDVEHACIKTRTCSLIPPGVWLSAVICAKPESARREFESAAMAANISATKREADSCGYLPRVKPTFIHARTGHATKQGRLTRQTLHVWGLGFRV